MGDYDALNVLDLFIDRIGGVTIQGTMPAKAALRSQLVLMLVSRLVGGTSCPPERLVVYKMELQTFWDEQTFPKQYPQVDDNVQNYFETDIMTNGNSDEEYISNI